VGASTIVGLTRTRSDDKEAPRRLQEPEGEGGQVRVGLLNCAGVCRIKADIDVDLHWVLIDSRLAAAYPYPEA